MSRAGQWSRPGAPSQHSRAAGRAELVHGLLHGTDANPPAACRNSKIGFTQAEAGGGPVDSKRVLPNDPAKSENQGSRRHGPGWPPSLPVLGVRGSAWGATRPVKAASTAAPLRSPATAGPTPAAPPHRQGVPPRPLRLQPRLGFRAGLRAGQYARQRRAGGAILPDRLAAHPLLPLQLHRGQAGVEQVLQWPPAQRVDPRPHRGMIVAPVAKPQPHRATVSNSKKPGVASGHSVRRGISPRNRLPSRVVVRRRRSRRAGAAADPAWRGWPRAGPGAGRPPAGDGRSGSGQPLGQAGLQAHPTGLEGCQPDGLEWLQQFLRRVFLEPTANEGRTQQDRFGPQRGLAMVAEQFDQFGDPLGLVGGARRFDLWRKLDATPSLDLRIRKQSSFASPPPSPN